MASGIANKAETEYAVMLAVLNFQAEFMKSPYSHVQAYVYDEPIYVTSTRNVSISAEKELTRSPEGHDLLRRFHRAMYDSCQILLQTRLEQAIGVKIQSIVTDLDPEAGRSTLVIKLLEPLSPSTHTLIRTIMAAVIWMTMAECNTARLTFQDGPPNPWGVT
jgi:uncharacterized protein YbcI